MSGYMCLLTLLLLIVTVTAVDDWKTATIPDGGKRVDGDKLAGNNDNYEVAGNYDNYELADDGCCWLDPTTERCHGYGCNAECCQCTGPCTHHNVADCDWITLVILNCLLCVVFKATEEGVLRGPK